MVENTISEYQIGPKTLATRVGGIIGVGKNLLWILIFRNGFIKITDFHFSTLNVSNILLVVFFMFKIK